MLIDLNNEQIDRVRNDLRAVAPSGRLGSTLIETTQSGREIHTDLVQCCHCGAHWKWQVGSGRVRGFCQRCNGHTCGCKKCNVCVPKLQQVENMEKGVHRLYLPFVSYG